MILIFYYMEIAVDDAGAIWPQTIVNNKCAPHPINWTPLPLDSKGIVWASSSLNTDYYFAAVRAVRHQSTDVLHGWIPSRSAQ